MNVWYTKTPIAALREILRQGNREALGQAPTDDPPAEARPESVHDYRLAQARARSSQKRNPKRCICDHDAAHCTPLTSTKKRGVKLIKLARHGSVHLPRAGRTCGHSTMPSVELFEQYEPGRWRPVHRQAPNRDVEQRPALRVAERKSKMRRLAALPNIPVLILEA